MNHHDNIPGLSLIMGAVLLLAACEKDISLNYHQVDPIYVVEGSISNQGTEVRISHTNAMDDNSSISDISGAKVTIMRNDGTETVIPYSRNGFYRSSLRGLPDSTYTLFVEVDGHFFSSTSTMQSEPKMNQFRLVWMKAATERILFGDLRLQDNPKEDNWYFMHIYRNHIGYRWAVMRDDQNPGRELQQLFSLFREGSNDSDVLQEGDVLTVEIRTIDQRSYDYLYSMQVMDNTGTNPIKNFSGECLGYFSAYYQITYETTFHLADVAEEE